MVRESDGDAPAPDPMAYRLTRAAPRLPVSAIGDDIGLNGDRAAAFAGVATTARSITWFLPDIRKTGFGKHSVGCQLSVTFGRRETSEKSDQRH